MKRPIKTTARRALSAAGLLALLALLLLAVLAGGASGHPSARRSARVRARQHARSVRHARRLHRRNHSRVHLITLVFSPAPVPAHRGGALTLCPSPAGLERFAAAAIREARSDALAYGRVSITLDLSHSDRAWQGEVRAMWKTIKRKHPQAETVAVRSVAPASSNAYQIIVRHSCGAKLIRHSLVVTIAPVPGAGEAPCSACAESFFLIDRRGRALIYFVY